MEREATLHEGSAVKVYLDLCVYNPPFDDQTQPRIMMESLGVVTIMALPAGIYLQGGILNDDDYSRSDTGGDPEGWLGGSGVSIGSRKKP